MLNRRDFMQVAIATAAAVGSTGLAKRAAAQALGQSDLLRFRPVGQVTLLHLTDIHAQLVPVYFREPSINIGVGEAAGLPPHLTGRDLLRHFDILPGTPEAYALTSEYFVSL
ncbi:MAG: thiosulfohydrolase SoxB, partial [Inquilinus sp.]|nr:thiosulfohydrolase SoxB [Inquilinus sp.]